MVSVLLVVAGSADEGLEFAFTAVGRLRPREH